MHVIARARRTIARHPFLYWSVVAGLALALSALVVGAVRDIDAQRRSWGTTREVWVTGADLHAGDRVVAAPRELPTAMIPAAAVADDPSGRVARQSTTAGEVITTADVTGDGVAALLPADSVALAIANTAGATLRIGDSVVVFESGRRLAAGLVVATTEEAVMVAVDESVAPAVSQAALDGTAVVGLDG
jgi:hypothetical protein